MLLRILLTVISGGLVLPPPGMASLLPPDPVLAGYIDAAMTSNLALRQQRLSVDEALAALAQARAQFSRPSRAP